MKQKERPLASFQSSSPRESHPQALTEPYVNLSIHTALIIHPYGLHPSAQCANMLGSLFASPCSQFIARTLQPLNLLNLHMAQHTSLKLRCRMVAPTEVLLYLLK
jgi:hypothetical protein